MKQFISILLEGRVIAIEIRLEMNIWKSSKTLAKKKMFYDNSLYEPYVNNY